MNDIDCLAVPQRAVGISERDIPEEFSLALIWHTLKHQASLGVENRSNPTLDTTVAPLGSNPCPAFHFAKSGAGVGLSIFIGQFSDPSGLSYLNARYYDSSRGQFLSEDPNFLSSSQNFQDPQSLNTSRTRGSASNLISASGLNGNAQRGSNSTSGWASYLADPQAQNPYAYGRDNPIINRDPTGLCFEPVSAVVCALAVYGVAMTGIDSYSAYVANVEYPTGTTQQKKDTTKFKLGYDLFTELVGGQAVSVGLKGVDVALGALQATADFEDTFFPEQTYRLANYNQIQSQQTLRSRQQVVANYNATFGTSAPQSKLYETPNGAVVNWSGTVISNSLSAKH